VTKPQTPLPPPPQPLPPTLSLPILMYHHIAEPPAQVGGFVAQLYVRPQAFAEQMAYLRKAGYHLVTAGELAGVLLGERGLPKKPAVLTFDDGYEDFYANAWPVLQQYGFKATLFVSTNAVGTPGHLTWDQLRELRDAGMEVAAHGVTHRSLTRMSLEAAQRELADSKRTIETRIGAPVRVFSYPTGAYNADVVFAVAAAGYDAAVTADGGVVQDVSRPYELKRSRIKLRHDLGLFRARIGVGSSGKGGRATASPST